jgi:hypothetical protein
MSVQPQLRFLSLFVPDLEAARGRYEAVLGVPASANDGTAPEPHPFASDGPVLFDLGTVKLALYEANPHRGTHPGDVGLGVQVDASPAEMAKRASSQGAKVFYGPKPVPGDRREMAVFVLPDRHFFEAVGPKPST